MPDEPLIAIRVVPGDVATLPGEPDAWATPTGFAVGIEQFLMRLAWDALPRALGVAERAYYRAALRIPRPRAATNAGSRSVLVVGLGIVNLVSVHRLVREGFIVTALDAAPDPRAWRDWREYGCTRGGGNARMFTLTEADDYHDRRLDAAPLNDQFRRSVSQGGWLVCRPTTDEEQWIRDFERVPPWRARAYNADILAFNRGSGALWEDWMLAMPELFADVGLRHDILRLYSEEDDYATNVKRHALLGSTREVLSATEVRTRFPAMSDVPDHALAGGIVVRGFTLQVHDFMAALLDDIERLGADVRFETPVTELLRDRDGCVTGAVAGDNVMRHDSYLLSPGTGLSTLSPPPALANRIHGVLGAWATVPNVNPRLRNSLKIARKGHLAEDANVTVAHNAAGEPVLMVGSGYGYIGAGREIDRAELDTIFDALVDTIATYFPRALKDMTLAGVRKTFRYCVRPWTASCLGVFEIEPSLGGVAIWTGGHNTGGFAQAPIVAEAVLAALIGARHPMHVAYAAARHDGALNPTMTARRMHDEPAIAQ